jgi:hypothetical protein
MPDSILFNEEAYVLLETNQEEQILTPEEMLSKIKVVLEKYTDNLSSDIAKFGDLESRSKYVLENYCEWDVGMGKYLQWYAIRLEK